MGGKALNKYGIFTERKNTEEFNKIGFFFQKRLNDDLKLVTNVVKCYHTKVDHGDLDLLIEIDKSININWHDYINKTFKPQAINVNGGVYSFDYDGFQVDFIPISKIIWDCALVYFSYDPLGNILGKTFHKFGLSYGWDGLKYKFRGFNGTLVNDILISTDSRKIFDFGGYNYDRYLLGFETLEDIFQFCINGKYFDSEIFKFENLKHIDKKRNRKRGSYHQFLKYLIDNNINIRYPFNKNKEDYLPMIDSAFPEAKLLDILQNLKEIDSKKKIISQKFNGDIVLSWIPNLMGKELGAAITRFKIELGNNYDDFILNNNYNTIKNKFFEIYHGVE